MNYLFTILASDSAPHSQAPPPDASEMPNKIVNTMPDSLQIFLIFLK